MGLMLRLLMGPGPRSPALNFLCLALLCDFGVSTGWALLIPVGASPGRVLQHFLDAGAMTAYALVGAAALHPSAAKIALPASPRPPGLSAPLLLGLGAVSLLAPSLLALQSLRGTSANGFSFVTGSTVVFLLVAASMIQVLRHVQTQAKHLQELARVDALTGLPNRRAWATELPIALERARRKRSLLTVAKIEPHQFRRFSDTHGPAAADELLRAASAEWRGRLRIVDLIVRYESEDFIVLLPDADAGQAAMVLDRLRAVTPSGQTFSGGVATWDGVESGPELVARADEALEQAKRRGAGATVLSPAPPAAPGRDEPQRD
jgi:diguanylate cyclase (GGDEF)-like protein